MARDTIDEQPIAGKADLIAWIAKGEKPASAFRLGTEHEKVPFRPVGLEPVAYEGENGIRALLEKLGACIGWEPILEQDRPSPRRQPRRRRHQPGAGRPVRALRAPVETLHETEAETARRHIADWKAIAEGLGFRFLTLGMSPLWTRAQTPVMPKSRYKIMANYMPKVGSKGLDMMFRTTTVQVNLDFASEADMVKKLRVSLALQPLASALFANSPFTDGKPNGFLSYRSEIWRDTDNNRAGMLPFAFEDGMGYERYVDYALDVPMYFIKRGDSYLDVTGSSFRDLLAGRHPALPGEKPIISDWANHVSTIFPR